MANKELATLANIDAIADGDSFPVRDLSATSELKETTGTQLKDYIAAFPLDWVEDAGTSITIDAADMNGAVDTTNAAAVTVTVNVSTGAVDDQFAVKSSGVGGVTITAGTATFQPPGDVLLVEGQSAHFYQSATDIWEVTAPPPIISSAQATADAPSVLTGLWSPFRVKESAIKHAHNYRLIEGPDEATRTWTDSEPEPLLFPGPYSSVDTDVAVSSDNARGAVVWCAGFGSTITAMLNPTVGTSVAAETAKISVYTIADDGGPGVRLFVLDGFDIETSGEKEATSTEGPVAAQWVWMFLQNDSAATSATFRGRDSNMITVVDNGLDRHGLQQEDAATTLDGDVTAVKIDQSGLAGQFNGSSNEIGWVPMVYIRSLA